MPTLYAHYLNGENIFNRLPDYARHVIASYRDAYDLGCQGPDIFFFHLTRVKSIKPLSMHRLGNLIHEANIEDFFNAAVSYILNAGNDAQKLLAAYFWGYLTHYALDTTCHAYVKYFCGHRHSHAYFETLMDLSLLDYRGIDRKALPHYELVKASRQTRASVAAFYSSVINKAHGKNISVGAVNKSIARMYWIERILWDKSGFKSFTTKTLEKLAKKRRGAYSSIIYPKIQEDIDCLNLKKQGWVEPWGSNPRNESFLELFEQAGVRGVKYGELFCDGLASGNMQPLLSELGGLSFVTGHAWQKALKEKYTGGLL